MSNFSKKRALLVCLLTGIFAVSGAKNSEAQNSASPSGFPQQPTTDLGFVMDAPTDAGFNANVQSRVVHDDNIFNNNADRRGDFVFEESALFNLWDKQPTWNIGLQYQPTALLYQSASSLNAVDQQLKAQGGYHFNPEFHLAWNEMAEDRTSLLQPSSNQYFLIPVGPPPGLNDTVSTPLAREISSQTQGHAIYEPSYRTSWDLMGSYEVMTFSGIGAFSPDLLNTKGAAGGLEYQYRETQHFTIGAKYLFEDYYYGSESSDQVQSGYLTVLWNVGPHAMLSLFGGAQYSDASGVLPFASPGQFIGKPEWVPAGGGSFTLKSDRTALQFAAQRIVTSGGGLLGTVTSAYGGVELRRRLTEEWDLVLTGSGAQTQQIQSGAVNGNIETQAAGIAVEHAIFQNLFFHGEYDFLRQRVNQFVPLGTDINRNQYTVSVFYAFGEHRL